MTITKEQQLALRFGNGEITLEEFTAEMSKLTRTNKIKNTTDLDEYLRLEWIENHNPSVFFEFVLYLLDVAKTELKYEPTCNTFVEKFPGFTFTDLLPLLSVFKSNGDRLFPSTRNLGKKNSFDYKGVECSLLEYWAEYLQRYNSETEQEVIERKKQELKTAKENGTIDTKLFLALVKKIENGEDVVIPSEIDNVELPLLTESEEEYKDL